MPILYHYPVNIRNPKTVLAWYHASSKFPLRLISNLNTQNNTSYASSTSKYLMQFSLLSHVSFYSFSLFSPCNPALHGLSTLHFLTPPHNLSTRPKFHTCGSQNLHFMSPKKYIMCLTPFNRG